MIKENVLIYPKVSFSNGLFNFYPSNMMKDAEKIRANVDFEKTAWETLRNTWGMWIYNQTDKDGFKCFFNLLIIGNDVNHDLQQISLAHAENLNIHNSGSFNIRFACAMHAIRFPLPLVQYLFEVYPNQQTSSGYSADGNFFLADNYVYPTIEE